MYKLYCRLYQLAFRITAIFLPWRRPQSLKNFEAVAAKLRQGQVKSVLLVTDENLAELGYAARLQRVLTKAGLAVTIYDGVVENPTVTGVEAALALYHQNDCQALIALGGGSSIDTAKAVGARVAWPHRSLKQLSGELRVLKKIPPLVAIPTTAGTGSEASVAAVISDPDSDRKFTINDLVLIPRFVVLDPKLTLSLPPFYTAATGMDVLTHFVEAYLGGSNTEKTRDDAIRATQLVFGNLVQAYQHGDDLTARTNMQRAAYLAGCAFTRAYVGNIHAISHTLSGKYHAVHGYANAIIMPYVLERYGAAAHHKLAQLAVAAGVSDPADTDAQNAESFIEAIRQLNRTLDIPTTYSDLQAEDIPQLVGYALKEANPLYPVPVIFDRADMTAIYEQLLTR